jgi:DNA-binding beta-propeller fold protein YncE
MVAVASACAGSNHDSSAVEPTPAKTDALKSSEATVRATVQLGGANRLAIGAGSVWVTDDGAGQLVRVDPRNARVVARVAVGERPEGVAVGKGGVWVAGSERVSGDTQSTGNVWRIDPDTNEVVAATKVPSILLDVAVGEGAVWASNGGHGRFGAVWRIDPRTNQLASGPIRVGGGPSDVEVAYGSVWVALADDGAVTRIDPTTNEVGEPIRVGAGPFSLAIGAGAVWVLNTNDGTVMRIDPNRGKVTGAALRVGATPSDLAVNSNALWVTNAERGRVLQLDSATGQIRNELPVAGGPFAVAAGMGSVWVTDNFDGTLTRIDP